MTDRHDLVQFEDTRYDTVDPDVLVAPVVLENGRLAVRFSDRRYGVTIIDDGRLFVDGGRCWTDHPISGCFGSD